MTYLRDIVRHIKGAVFKSKDYQNNGVAVVRVSDFEGESINLENLYYVSSEVAAQNKKVTLKTYDVVITTVGATAGNFIRVPKEANGFLLNQNTVRLRVKTEDESDQIYLFYALKNKNFKEYLLAGAQGSAQPSIVLDQILGAEIEYPDADIRKKIAKCLFDYDQKIQLNTQTNQTLEHIAQAIYKSWFVDYEPTRAKAAVLAAGGSMAEAETAAMTAISGKTAAELAALKQHDPARYQQLADLAAAFPAALVPTDDFGEIPEGWEVKRIEDVIQKIPVGKKYSQKTVTEKGKVPVLDQGKSGLIGYHNDKAGVQASLENPVIVFANHTCYMRLITYDFSAIQNVFAFRGKNCNVLWLYLATLGKQQFVEYKGHFPDFLIKDIVVPPDELTEIFGRQVKHLFYKVAINDKENKTLSETRDAILPKLLSGDFSDAKTS